MANEEHLKILKQGVEAWKAWREDDLDVFPDQNGGRLLESLSRGEVCVRREAVRDVGKFCAFFV